MANITSLETLPAELCLLIVDCLPLKEINILARTTRYFHETLNPHLYKLHIREHGGEGIFIWAAKRGHVKTIKSILQGAEETKISDLVNCTDRRFKLTALSWAAAKGHDGVVKLLLSTPGTNPDPRNKLNRSPLSHAAENRHVEVVKSLLEAGVDVNSQDTVRKWTPLSWAIVGRDDLRAISFYRCDKHEPEYNLDDLWNFAALHGGPDAVNPERRHKLEQGYDIPWSMDRMRLPALWPYRKGLKRELPTYQHCSCLTDEYHKRKEQYEAQWAAWKQIVLLLLDGGADVNTSRYLPLAVATDFGGTELVKLLLSRGAEIKKDNCILKGGPLARAAGNGDVDILTVLLEGGGVFSRRDLEEALEDAAMRGHAQIIKILLSQPLEPHPRAFLGERRGFGLLALEQASKRGFTEAVDVMLGHYRRTWPNDRPHELAIWWAAYAGWETVFRMLLDDGTPLVGRWIASENKISVLSAAIMGRNLKTMKLLLPAVDIQEKDDHGWTAMMWASFIGNYEAIDLLSTQGAVLLPKEEIDMNRWEPPHVPFKRHRFRNHCARPCGEGYPLSFGGPEDDEKEVEEVEPKMYQLSPTNQLQFEGWIYNGPIAGLGEPRHDPSLPSTAPSN